MFIKVLYVVLVLCVVAVVGAVIAGYLRIRRHMNGKTVPQQPTAPGTTEQNIRR